jgi:outer membrane protein OmpA-like peptidoglycan-associated protein
VAGAEVLITDLYRNVSRRVYTDHEGKFQCMLEKDAFYSIMTVKKAYFDAGIQKVSTIGLKTPQKIEAFITMRKVELNKTYQLEGINFELNQASFSQEALQALGQILDFLRHHTGAVVEIGVHTDARGDDEHNLQLSQQRAEQIAMFLFRKGIPKKQVVAAGYGETTPVNECRNGVKCTSSQHQANRRVEFKIVSMKI